jgi:hypothetical protein
MTDTFDADAIDRDLAQISRVLYVGDGLGVIHNSFLSNYGQAEL